MSNIDSLYKEKLKPYPKCPYCGNILSVDFEHHNMSCRYCHKCKEIHGNTDSQMVYNWNKYCAETLDDDRILVPVFGLLTCITVLHTAKHMSATSLILFSLCMIIDAIFLASIDYWSYQVAKLRIQISIGWYDLKLKKKYHDSIKEKESIQMSIQTPIQTHIPITVQVNQEQDISNIDHLIKQLSVYNNEQVKTIINILQQIKLYNNEQFNQYIINDSYDLISALQIKVITDREILLNQILDKYIDLFNNYLIRIKDFDTDIFKLKAILMNLKTKI